MHGTRPFWPRRNRRRTRVPVKQEAAKRESVEWNCDRRAMPLPGPTRLEPTRLGSTPLAAAPPESSAAWSDMPRDAAQRGPRSEVAGVRTTGMEQASTNGCRQASTWGGRVTPCAAVVAVPTDRIRGGRSDCGDARGSVSSGLRGRAVQLDCGARGFSAEETLGRGGGGVAGFEVGEPSAVLAPPRGAQRRSDASERIAAEGQALHALVVRVRCSTWLQPGVTTVRCDVLSRPSSIRRAP